MTETLSGEEVSSLLQDAGGKAAGSTIRPYDFTAQERIVRGRMPGLELINERFGRLLRLGLFNFMRRSTDVSVGPVRVLPYGEFVRELSVPANINMVQLKPLRGTALFVFDPNLVFVVVDTMFGGMGRVQALPEAHEFTPTEHRILQRLLGVVFEDYERSWDGVHKLKCEYLRSEMNPRFAAIVGPHEVVVATSFKIELGTVGGHFHVCIPYQTLEPLRDLIYTGMQGTQRDLDRQAATQLAQELKSAEVELSAQLARIPSTLRQVIAMKPGDVIPLDIPDGVDAEVDGVPVMECTYGVFNGRYALKVERWLAARNGSGDNNG